MQNLKINELIINKLNDLHLTISTCESMTGGAIASYLVLVEHASDSFLGSLVTYSKQAKVKLAGVDSQADAISSICAQQMALGCKKTFKSDIAISVTGNASGDNPMAYVCIVLFDKIYDLKYISTYKDSQNVISQCVAFCLNKLWELIKDLKK